MLAVVHTDTPGRVRAPAVHQQCTSSARLACARCGHMNRRRCMPVRMYRRCTTDAAVRVYLCHACTCTCDACTTAHREERAVHTRCVPHACHVICTAYAVHVHVHARVHVHMHACMCAHDLLWVVDRGEQPYSTDGHTPLAPGNARLVHMQRTCIVHAARMQRTCSAHATTCSTHARTLHARPYTARTLPVHCPCTARALPVHCPCTARALPVDCMRVPGRRRGPPRPPPRTAA